MSLRSPAHRKKVIVALAVAMAVPICALDLLTQHGIATWLLYLVPLLLASKVTGPRATCLLAGGFTALIWFGHRLSFTRDSSTIDLLNCSLAVVVLWVATLFLVQRIRGERRAEAERDRLLGNLAVEKARWEATVESMLDPVTVCDAEGRVIYLNPAHSHMDGRQVQAGLQFEAHPEHYQLYRPEGTLFAAQDLPLQRAALFGKEMRDVEVVHRTAGARDRVIIWNAAPVRDADGLVTGAVAVGRDITALREAQRALQQSELAYRTLAENAPDIIERFNRQGTYTYVNRVGIHVRGMPAEAILGKTIAEIGVPGPYATRWRGRIEQVFATGEPTEAEDGLLTRDGIRTFHSRFVPERAADGSVASVLVFSHDITERKRVEGKLRASEERLRLAQQAGGTGTWEWDIATNGVTWSEEYYRIAGLSSAQTPASFDRWLQSVHADDRARVMQASVRAVEEHADLDVEFRIIRPDGSVRWLNEKGRTFYAEDGLPVRMLGISLDITERKLAEEALRSARDALEKQLEERTAELTGVSRRLQVEATPAEDAGAAIRGLSELLNRRVGELAALDKVTWALASSLDPAQVLRLLVSEVRGLLDADGASVLLYEPERDELTFVAAEGPGAEALVGERVPAGASLAGWVLRERRAALVNDVRDHPLVVDSPKVLL
ncbi:MAG TPA: PAS domain S-box protein, partial [Candidatus Methylomirabilis sp.]|nr:PAS domain S-box protein [Candidatus Methylomirabilis sp.]